MHVVAIPAFDDNYIWAIHDDQFLIVVDPGESAPVEAFMSEHQLKLIAILITHHHLDHVNGIQRLCQLHPSAEVYGPQENIPHCHHPLTDSDKLVFQFPSCQFQVLTLPGHTLGHVAYYGELLHQENPVLFCGDTLFHCGCGRLFEGSPSQMMSSLTRLAALPDETQVYCTHEYSLSNLAFSQAVEPTNSVRDLTLQAVKQLRAQNKPSLPTSIGVQKKINPFLRTKNKEIKQRVELWCQRECLSELDLFTQLRQWKDQF